MKKENKNITEISKNAKEKSCNPDIIVRRGRSGSIARLDFEKSFLAIATTVIIAASSLTGVIVGVESHSKYDISSNDVYREYLSSFNYIVNDNTWNNGAEKDSFGYDHRGIATDIMGSEDFDVAVFAVFNKIGTKSGYDGQTNMDMIIQDVDTMRKDDGKKYGSFDGYLASLSLSEEEYMDKMAEYVKAKALEQQALDMQNESGMRF